MKRVLSVALAVLCLVALAPRVTLADHGDAILRATLLGIHEVPANSTPARARFTAVVHDDGSIDFRVTFSDLSANPLVAHIHFGQFNVNGGVMIFLCGGGGQPACPAATTGSFTGTIAPANVVGPTAQGISAGDLATALRAIRIGDGYANIHNTRFPNGEVRGQVRAIGDLDDDHDD